MAHIQRKEFPLSPEIQEMLPKLLPKLKKWTSEGRERKYEMTEKDRKLCWALWNDVSFVLSSTFSHILKKTKLTKKNAKTHKKQKNQQKARNSKNFLYSTR